MSYQFSLHTDQDNLHFHLSFAEKKPNYKSYGKELKYRHAGKLTQKELGFLKNEIEHYIEKEKVFTPLLTKTNKKLDNLKKYFSPKDKNFLLRNKDDILLEDKIMRLGELLSNSRSDINQRVKYNSIKNKEIRQLTNEIKKQIFSKDSNFKEEYKGFKNTLKEINQYFISVAQINNIDIVDDSLVKSKNKYFDNYVMNAIVNHVYYKSQHKNISENDIIREMIYKQYKQSKYNSKYDIVLNYLSNLSKSNQFKNKYEIKQAVKSINDELEDAQKEFEKLFIVDKEYTK